MTEDFHRELEKCRIDTLDIIANKVAKIDLLVESQRRMEEAQAEMAKAITKLAVIEERQEATRSSLAKIDKKIESIENRIDRLEQHEQSNKAVRSLLYAVLTAIIITVVGVVLASVGLSK